MLKVLFERGFWRWWLIAVAMVCLRTTAWSAPVVAIARTNAAPGATAQVPVTFTTDTSVASLQFDLVYNPATLTAGTPTGGDALADHEIASSQVSSNALRVLIFSFSGATLHNGVLVYVPMTIVSNETATSEPLVLTNVVLSSPAGTMVTPVTVSNGSLGITIPLARPQFNAIGLTGGVPHVGLKGLPGTNYVIQTATNLAAPQWKSVYTNVANGGGSLLFFDAAAAGVTNKYYRAFRTN